MDEFKEKEEQETRDVKEDQSIEPEVDEEFLKREDVE